MHLVFRLQGPPVLLVEGGVRHDMGYCLIGGARSGFHVKDVSEPSSSVGAQLLPGAAQALFGTSARELAGRHTRLEDVWGLAAEHARDQLLAAGDSAGRQLDVMEALLAARLPRIHSLHPAIAHALQGIQAGHAVGGVISGTGYSHRHFVSVFRDAVGLPPKVYARVLRFQHALKLAHADMTLPWVEVAAAAGFSDQAHFAREFREFSGSSPQAWRRSRPEYASHLVLASKARPA